MKVAIPIVITVVALFIYHFSGHSRRVICKLTPRFHSDTIAFGEFSETIPQTGVVEVDSSSKSNVVINVAVDELYFGRITAGLAGFTTISNQDYILELTDVDTMLHAGRFNTEFRFTETSPALNPGQSIHLRIQLSILRQSLLLPIGGFYKDTGGQWIYIVNQSGILVKRRIVLGCKNSEYFEVLGGLDAGDVVITSSYQQFANGDNLHIEEIKRLYE